MLAGELQVVVANVQFLKPCEVVYSDSPENGARDLLATRCSQSTGLVESGEHSFESNARLLRCRGSCRRIHGFDRFHFQKLLPPQDALEDKHPGDRTEKKRNCRKL